MTTVKVMLGAVAMGSLAMAIGGSDAESRPRRA
jgi:hypothetical protein